MIELTDMNNNQIWIVVGNCPTCGHPVLARTGGAEESGLVVSSTCRCHEKEPSVLREHGADDVRP